MLGTCKGDTSDSDRGSPFSSSYNTSFFHLFGAFLLFCSLTHCSPNSFVLSFLIYYITWNGTRCACLIYSYSHTNTFMYVWYIILISWLYMPHIRVHLTTVTTLNIHQSIFALLVLGLLVLSFGCWWSLMLIMINNNLSTVTDLSYSTPTYLMEPPSLCFHSHSTHIISHYSRFTLKPISHSQKMYITCITIRSIRLIWWFRWKS